MALLLDPAHGLDAWAWAMVLVAAVFHGAALVAAGTAWFRLVFALPPALEQALGLRSLVRSAVGLAFAALLLQWPLLAGFLGGGSLAAAFDPALLGMVIEGAQGRRMLLAGGGLLLLLLGVALAAPRWRGLGTLAGLAGAVLVWLAYTQVGHTTTEPGPAPALLLLHLAAVAFWSAALVVLYRMLGLPAWAAFSVDTLERFGRLASLMLPALIAAGAGLLWTLLPGWAALLESAYGQWLTVKLALLGLLLLLAALNRWHLVPALRRGDPRARRRLRASILSEALLVGLILLLTARLTATALP